MWAFCLTVCVSVCVFVFILYTCSREHVCILKSSNVADVCCVKFLRQQVKMFAPLQAVRIVSSEERLLREEFFFLYFFFVLFYFIFLSEQV